MLLVYNKIGVLKLILILEERVMMCELYICPSLTCYCQKISTCDSQSRYFLAAAAVYEEKDRCPTRSEGPPPPTPPFYNRPPHLISFLPVSSFPATKLEPLLLAFLRAACAIAAFSAIDSSERPWWATKLAAPPAAGCILS